MNVLIKMLALRMASVRTLLVDFRVVVKMDTKEMASTVQVVIKPPSTLLSLNAI